MNRAFSKYFNIFKPFIAGIGAQSTKLKVEGVNSP